MRAEVLRLRSAELNVAEGAVEISAIEYAPAQRDRLGPLEYEEAGGGAHRSVRAARDAVKCRCRRRRRRSDRQADKRGHNNPAHDWPPILIR